MRDDVYFSDAGVGAIYRSKSDCSALTEILNKSHTVWQVEGQWLHGRNYIHTVMIR